MAISSHFAPSIAAISHSSHDRYAIRMYTMPTLLSTFFGDHLYFQSYFPTRETAMLSVLNSNSHVSSCDPHSFSHSAALVTDMHLACSGVNASLFCDQCSTVVFPRCTNHISLERERGQCCLCSVTALRIR